MEMVASDLQGRLGTNSDLTKISNMAYHYFLHSPTNQTADIVCGLLLAPIDNGPSNDPILARLITSFWVDACR